MHATEPFQFAYRSAHSKHEKIRVVMANECLKLGILNIYTCTYCVFSHDVMAALFVSQNNETGVMFVSQTSPVGVELFSYVNSSFCSNKFA